MKMQGYIIIFCLFLILLGYAIWVFRRVLKVSGRGSAGKQRIGRPGFCFTPQTSAVVIFLSSVALLIAAGGLYRVVSGRLGFIVQTPIKLPVPLSGFPYELGSWKGEDLPLSEAVKRAARNDDYLNRTYINRSTNEHVNVYVAFTARPRTMFGHRPTVCYPASGWVHDGTVNTEVSSLSGRIIPSLLHRFHRTAPNSDALVVLNFYIVNGELTNDESIFSGIFWRTPNIRGNPARYVAQVQISSVSENSVRAASRDISDLLITFFPRGSRQKSGQAEIK
jgi:EpsI family protein